MKPLSTGRIKNNLLHFCDEGKKMAVGKARGESKEESLSVNSQRVGGAKQIGQLALWVHEASRRWCQDKDPIGQGQSLL